MESKYKIDENLKIEVKTHFNNVHLDDESKSVVNLYFDQKYYEAFEKLNAVYDSNNRLHNFIYGALYYSGDGVIRDYKKSANYLLLSDRKMSSGMLGTMYHYGLGVRKNHKKAAMYYMQSSEDTSSSLYGLHLLFRDGEFFEKNKAVSDGFLEMWRSSLRGQSESVARANLYRFGRGVQADEKQFLKILSNAAKKDTSAMLTLADYYYDRSDRNRHADKIYNLYKKSAFNGEICGFKKYIIANAFGKLKRSSLSEAIKMYELSVSVDIQTNLTIYKDCEEMDSKSNIDGRTASEFFDCVLSKEYERAEKLAWVDFNQGSPREIHFLADMYFVGYGVEKNQNLAIELYKKAEENGIRYAYCLLLGIGMDQDVDKAIALLNNGRFDDFGFPGGGSRW